MAAVSKTPGGCAGRVGDGAVALLPADAGRVLVVGEMGPTCSVDTALLEAITVTIVWSCGLLTMITRHQHTAPVFTTRSPLILLTSCMYIRGVVTLVRGHAAEVTLVVVAVDGALRARVPLQAAVRGPPPGVALYLADEDVPVLGEGGAGPGEGQRVARVLGKSS